MTTISHVMHQVAHGSLSFDDIVMGTRGVTGSEQAMLFLARAQAAAGNRVSCYLPTEKPGMAYGVELIDIRSTWPRFRRAETADVAVAWLSADSLRTVNPKTLRIHSLQINDWLLCGPEFDKYVDVFVAVSQAHKKALETQLGCPSAESRWEIIPNGVDFTRFSSSEQRVPFRCVYLSSPDRGLHWLLHIWPEIKFAFPEAELHVFYEVNAWKAAAKGLANEIGIRADYVLTRGQYLEQHGGVVFRNAVSPSFLAEELSKADLLLYPCDTVRFTEGFGVAVLEACAAGVVPVMTDCDALGEIYQSSGAIMIPRGEDGRWIDQYLEAVVATLGDRSLIESKREKVRAFAKTYDWVVVAKQWEDMIARRLHERNQTR